MAAQAASKAASRWALSIGSARRYHGHMATCGAYFQIDGLHDTAEWCDREPGHTGDHAASGVTHDEQGLPVRWSLTWDREYRQDRPPTPLDADTQRRIKHILTRRPAFT